MTAPRGLKETILGQRHLQIHPGALKKRKKEKVEEGSLFSSTFGFSPTRLLPPKQSGKGGILPLAHINGGAVKRFKRVGSEWFTPRFGSKKLESVQPKADYPPGFPGKNFFFFFPSSSQKIAHVGSGIPVQMSGIRSQIEKLRNSENFLSFFLSFFLFFSFFSFLRGLFISISLLGRMFFFLFFFFKSNVGGGDLLCVDFKLIEKK